MKMSKRRIRRSFTGLIFALPAMAAVAFIGVLPMLYTVLNSFSGGLSMEVFVGWENYRQLFASAAFQLGIRNTAVFYLTVLPMMVLLPLLLAAAVCSCKAVRHTLESLFFIPSVIPSASLLWFVDILCGDTGVLNSILVKMGQNPINFFAGIPAIVLLHCMFLYRYGGYNFFLYLIAFAGISKEQYETASINGAGRLQIFRLVELPQITPTILLCTAFSVMNGYSIYREAYLIGGAYPDTSLYLLQHFLNNSFRNLSYGKLCSAASVILSLCVFSIMIAFFILNRRKKRYEKE